MNRDSIQQARVEPRHHEVGADDASPAVGGWLRHVLDHLDYGIVLVDAAGRALHANLAAARLVQRGQPLHVQGGVLRAALSADDAAWHRALADARRGRRTLLRLGGTASGASLAVIPLLDGESAEHLVTLVVLGRPSICESLSTQSYARRHDLTHAESEVLALLCSGLRPIEIARRQGVQIATVRTQIGSIRAKTGVASVGALLQEIATLPPMAHALPGLPGQGAWLQ